MNIEELVKNFDYFELGFELVDIGIVELGF